MLRYNLQYHQKADQFVQQTGNWDFTVYMGHYREWEDNQIVHDWLAFMPMHNNSRHYVEGLPIYVLVNETDHSLRILKGSLLPQSTVPSYRDGEKRNAIIAAMSKPTKDGFWELQRDYVVNSPSTAASYCSGRSCNGWIHWINDAGQSLDDLYRSE